MKLSEYLELRPASCQALTAKEIKILGIRYIRGWPEKYANLEVPEQLVNLVQNGDFFSLYRKPSKTARKYKNWKPLLQPREDELALALDREYKNIMAKDA